MKNVPFRQLLEKIKPIWSSFIKLIKLSQVVSLSWKSYLEASRSRAAPPKIQVDSPKDSQNKRLIVSIPIVKELNLDLQPQKISSIQNITSDTTNCTPCHKDSV